MNNVIVAMDTNLCPIGVFTSFNLALQSFQVTFATRTIERNDTMLRDAETWEPLGYVVEFPLKDRVDHL